METFESAIHVFSTRTDLTVQAHSRDLERFQRERKFHKAYFEDLAPVETCYGPIPTATVLEYPHAVSRFYDIITTYQYLAKVYSKSRKAPVLVSIVGKLLEPGEPEKQALCLYWGFENKCIAQIEIESDGQIISVEAQGVHELKKQLGFLLPENSILFSPLEDKKPFDIIPTLSEELGIFLGDIQLEEYLKRCILKKSIDTWRFYKSERFHNQP